MGIGAGAAMHSGRQIVAEKIASSRVLQPPSCPPKGSSRMFDNEEVPHPVTENRLPSLLLQRPEFERRYNRRDGMAWAHSASSIDKPSLKEVKAIVSGTFLSSGIGA